jgi:hypothetical protein
MNFFVLSKNNIILTEISLEPLFPIGKCLVLFRTDLVFSVLFEGIWRQLQDELLELLETAKCVLVFVDFRLNLLDFYVQAF